MTRVEMLAVVLMLSALLEEELHCVFVQTTSPMETHWWSAPQRKKANAEQTLTVLPANLAKRANV